MPNSGAIRAGKAFVELALSGWDAFESGLNKAQKKVEAFGKNTAKIGLGMVGAGSAILAPITAIFASTANRANDIKLLSDKFNTNAETISAWAYAFERGGVSLDEFGGTLDSFRSKLFSAADGADDDFRRLGLNALALEKMNKTDAFRLVVDRINNLGKATDRQEMGLKFVGSAWDKLGTTVLRSSESFKALQKEAKDVGAIITNEQAAQGQKSVMAFTQAWQALKYGLMEVGMQLLPQADNIQRFVQKFSNGIQVIRRFIQDNSQLVIAVVAVGAALVVGGIALLAFSKIVLIVSATLGALGTIAGVFASGIGLLASPFVLATAAIVFMLARLDLIEPLLDSIKGSASSVGSTLTGVFDGLKGTIADVFGKFKESWAIVVEAFTAGDFESAIDVSMATIKASMASAVAWLTDVWVRFKDTVIGVFNEVTDKLEDAIAGFTIAYTEVTEGKEEADKFGAGLRDNLGRDRAKRDAANKAFRDNQIKEANKEKEEAAEKLKAAQANATAKADERAGVGDADENRRKRAAAMAAWTDTDDLKAGSGKLMAGILKAAKAKGQELPTSDQLYKSAKGTSSSYNIGQSLAYGDGIAERQLKTQAQMLKEQQETKKAIEALGLTWR